MKFSRYQGEGMEAVVGVLRALSLSLTGWNLLGLGRRTMKPNL